jgi:hypothetical protein
MPEVSVSPRLRLALSAFGRLGRPVGAAKPREELRVKGEELRVESGGKAEKWERGFAKVGSGWKPRKA